MKAAIAALACLTLTAAAEIKRPERRSLLDSDPEVVYLAQALKEPILLKVTKEASVFSDKDGRQRLGTLKANQTVQLEAITEKIYRVRGQGTRDGISGWVAPWAFSVENPAFTENLRKFYRRQIEVQKLIAARQVAVGMSLDEVKLALGKPTQTKVRKTEAGQSGTWEYIDYEDVKNYITEVDRATGAAYRRLVSVTRVEKSKTTVEFENEWVTAIEESEDRRGNNVKIIVPPVIFPW